MPEPQVGRNFRSPGAARSTWAVDMTWEPESCLIWAATGIFPIRTMATHNSARTIPHSADEQESLARQFNIGAKSLERDNRALM